MVYIIRSRENSVSSRCISKEEAVRNRIYSGSCTDADINFAISSGDPSLTRALNEKANQAFAEKKHLDRVHGEGVWDGKDNNGALYKDIPLGSVDPSKL